MENSANLSLVPLTVRSRSFVWGDRTYLMGVLNVTPDSFSDGGQFNNLAAAVAQANYLVESGADIIDIGGQSTKPGAKEVSIEEELNRVLPVVQAIRPGITVPISVDTTRSVVANAAVKAGADIVNDISAGTFDPDMFTVVAELGVPIVLMHIKGTPETMQKLTNYTDLIGEIYEFFEARIAEAIAAGIEKSKIIIDPGIGFAKNREQNIELLRNISKFRWLGCPVLIGVSRKSFIGHILNQPEPKDRVWGTAAACCAAIANSADILRVHDLPEMRDVSRVADAIFRIK